MEQLYHYFFRNMERPSIEESIIVHSSDDGVTSSPVKNTNITNMDYFAYYRKLPSLLYYDDNESYRACLRKVFRMNTETITPYASLTIEDIYPCKELDEESRDEMTFDSIALDKYMEILYKKTERIYAFRDLYEKAAAQMFSTDLKIGQAVLCSYDCFSWYHTCIWFYLVDENTDLGKIAEYQKLCAHFSLNKI
jgi:hypothetical protein